MFKLLFAILLFTICTACDGESETKSRKGPPPEIPFNLPVAKSNPRAFHSCDEMQAWRDKKWSEWDRMSARYNAWLAHNGGDLVDGGTPLASMPLVATAASSANIQEQGIDEPDRVKLDGEEVYFVRKLSTVSRIRYAIEILKVENLAPVQTLEIESTMRPELFVLDRVLAVISRSTSGTDITFYTWVYGRLKFRNSFSTASRFLAARLRNGKIFLVTSGWIGGENFDVQTLAVPCDQIQQSAIDDYGFNTTEIHRISFDDGETVESRGYLGRVSQIYMTNTNLYLFGSGYSWFSWDTRLISNFWYQSSAVTRFQLTEAEFEFQGHAFIEGWVRNQYSFGESKDGKALFVATSGVGGLANRLWTLQGKGKTFSLVAGSESFAPRETIRSVRILDDRAYVVTFEVVDPLFTLDLSNPLQVKILSHIEVPGFSAYLHGLGDGRLLGVGYGSSSPGDLFSVQFSLFGPGFTGAMSVYDQLEYGSRRSRVDVADDPHAFLYIQDKSLAVAPVRLADESGSVEFAGAVVLDLSDRISPVARWTHRDLIPTACLPKGTRDWWA